MKLSNVFRYLPERPEIFEYHSSHREILYQLPRHPKLTYEIHMGEVVAHVSSHPRISKIRLVPPYGSGEFAMHVHGADSLSLDLNLQGVLTFFELTLSELDYTVDAPIVMGDFLSSHAREHYFVSDSQVKVRTYNVVYPVVHVLFKENSAVLENALGEKTSILSPSLIEVLGVLSVILRC